MRPNMSGIDLCRIYSNKWNLLLTLTETMAKINNRHQMQIRSSITITTERANDSIIYWSTSTAFFVIKRIGTNDIANNVITKNKIGTEDEPIMFVLL